MKAENQTSHKTTNTRRTIRRVGTILIIMLASFGIGEFTGRAAAEEDISHSIGHAYRALMALLTGALPYVFTITAIAAIIICGAFWLHCRRMYLDLRKHPDDDVLWDRLEEALSVPLVLTDTFTLIVTFLLICITYASVAAARGADDGISLHLLIAGLVLYAIFAVEMIAIQKMIVDTEKKLNPQKRGDVLDLRFQEEWFDSCDEGEKQIVYRSAYRSYRHTQRTCLILLIITSVVAIVLNLDLLPVITVTIILLVNMLSYQLTGMKLQRRS